MSKFTWMRLSDKRYAVGTRILGTSSRFGVVAYTSNDQHANLLVNALTMYDDSLPSYKEPSKGNYQR